jgi:cyclase
MGESVPGSQETVAVTEVTPNMLVFATSTGNVAASVGPDGALLIGTPSAASTPQITSILAGRTKSAVRYVVIAPQDLTHSEGDAGWGRRGAFVAMQENALERLGGHAMGPARPLPRRLIQLGVDRPRVAFSEVLTFDMNGEALHIVRQTPAYSNADALVHFHVANAFYFGEVFPGDGYPEIDPSQGGKLDGFVKTLSPWTNPGVHIVPARGKVMNGADLKAFCDMVTAVRERVQGMLKAGQTEDQVIDGDTAACLPTLSCI